MQVLPITPRGYCKGVVRAIQIVEACLEDPLVPKPIHVLGMIVHNKFVVDGLTSKGAITLYEDHKSRLELLENITSGTVIVTAHGISRSVIDAIRHKGLYFVDATCQDVYRTHLLIEDYLLKGYHVLYLGKKSHPETEGVLGIDDKITLIETMFHCFQLLMK